MASLGLAYLDSDLDSEPEIVPESPPALPTTESPPTLPSTESPPTLFSTESPAIPLPPLDQSYTTLEAAIAAIDDHSRAHGYAMVSRRSKRTKKGVKKTVRLRCDRYGILPSERTENLDVDTNRTTTGIRNMTTVGNVCPFALSLRLQHDTQTWYTTVENPSHNHDPSPTPTHTIHRQRELANKADQIKQQLQYGVPTR